MPHQLLGDGRVDTGVEQQGGGAVAQVVEAHHEGVMEGG